MENIFLWMFLCVSKNGSINQVGLGLGTNFSAKIREDELQQCNETSAQTLLIYLKCGVKESVRETQNENKANNTIPPAFSKGFAQLVFSNGLMSTTVTCTEGAIVK